jgi:paraquat-inducible protein B
MEENKRELKKQEDKKREKELAFEKLIENERENREQLIKIFHQRKKEPSKDQNGDDKIDQEEELNMPKSITNQVKHEIYQLKNGCEYFEVEIQRYTNKIEDNKRKMNTDIKTKEALDDKRFKLIDKIRQNEKQKEQYINQIELALPVALDQFKKIDPVDGRTLIELGKAIYITKAKLQKLNNDLEAIEQSNNEYEVEEKQFTLDFDNKLKEKKNNEKNLRENETVFKNEQILKFGLEIDFDFLLTASKKTTFDRYENEYKKLKAESDRKIDVYKQKIEESKKKLQLETNKNTKELNEIKKKLQEKQSNDKKLEEKNSEITKKNNKKYQMYDLSEKKQKLKEILKLLKQQMDALKKEIDIFRRKGGHIYSTIASNLV